ncbi:hypothetical protein K439DRAFT_1335105 [Ramaria rubella]|nr:hypothetical protein K439DRAFT_1335105 [Ramaria rubella]
MKAAKYFSEPAKGFGPWTLLLSTRAIQHLKNFRRDDQKVWAIVKKKMQELSHSHFSDDNQKRLSGNDSDIPIYEAKLTRDLRLVYQIDIAPEDVTLHDHQVLRVWGIHTHAQMDDRLWKAISQHQSKIGGEYRRRCLYRDIRDGVAYPYSWPTVITTIPTEPVSNTSMSNDELLEALLNSTQFITSIPTRFGNSSSGLDIIAEQDAAHPFELTGSEQKIRDHNSSCFVLGRSGTGKTTTMVFKMMNYEMLKIQHAAQEAPVSSMPPFRQLFVTQSRILAKRVQDYFTKMMLSNTTEYQTPQDLERLAEHNQRIQEREDMMDLDEDDDNERIDLPKKFSELEDHHFPLFLTMDQLCKLLEADCGLSFKRPDEDNVTTDAVTSPTTFGGSAPKASAVTFDVFKYAYWPRFPEPLTRGIDPGLVYNEFLGVIKGSEETLDTGNDNNFLDRLAYLNHSVRRQSTFAKHRGRIYDLFERYTKLKGERGDYDAADRTHAILRALKGKPPSKRKVDYLYVDEVQDNLIVDARLLRLLCGNPHGLFWAGGMGSSFRFDDLKAFVHRMEVSDLQLLATRRRPVQPTPFQLDINYRSHAGVVNCAHSVIELITKFWPHSIDSLAKECGIVDGPRPIFFLRGASEAASYEQFLFHESLSVELGAQQCILVRNDQARESLRRQIGDIGLIMTLYEAKGLEFNDVLLYNFFSDSAATLSEWRVVLNKIQEADGGCHTLAPEFDETRHASLCLELKSLYVGITRARSHVWILDVSDKGEPMRMFWESQQLIQLCRPNDPLPKLAVKSTPEQWAQQGHALFKSKHFKHAMLCFERAVLPFERSVAEAYLLRELALRLSLQHGHKDATANACLKAAESFLVCVNLSLSEVRRTRYLALAADLYSLGNHVVEAAKTYLSAQRFTQAAQHFMRARLYEEAADVALYHRSQMDSKLADKCMGVVKLYLHREGHLRKAVKYFDNIEEQLEHLEDCGFDSSKIVLLESVGRWSDAAELHSREGRHLDAIALWLRAGDIESRKRASHCLLDSLWKTFPLGANLPADDSGDTARKRFLELLHTLRDDLNQTQREEVIKFFYAILNKDNTQLLSLARQSPQIPGSNPMLALLCLDQALSKPPRMLDEDARTVSRQLEDYDMYVQLLRTVILDWHKAEAAALLGLVDDTHEAIAETTQEFCVLSTSVLYKYLGRNQSHNEEIKIPSTGLPETIRDVLGQRMVNRVLEEHEVCLHTKAFRPCINFALHGICNYHACPRDHIPRGAHSVEAFNLRVRLHMQQILIVQTLDTSAPFVTRHHFERMRRIWQERLFDAVFPTLYIFGNTSAILENSIPEYQRALCVLRHWIHERFNSLPPCEDRAVLSDQKFLTDVVQTSTLAFTFDRTNALHYIRRAGCVHVVENIPPHLNRQGRYVVHDLLDFLQATSDVSAVAGACFVKHLLDQRIPIDIDTLLSMVESLFGRAIISSRDSLHQVTLPRSWILSLLSNRESRARSRDASVLEILIGSLRDLLEDICINWQGVEHLVYGRRPLSSLHFITRGVLAARICKCVTLLGYNKRDGRIRERIVYMMNSLNMVGRTFSPLVVQYIKAREWKDLSQAVRSSTDSPLDELIVLVSQHDKSLTTFHPPRGVNVLRYKHESDILVFAAYQKTIKFNPEATPFVPKSQQVATSLPDVEPEEDLELDEPAADEALQGEVQEVAIVPVDLSIPRTEAEIDAARSIQIWYRRRIAVKSKVKSSSDEARSQFYTTLQSEAQKLEVSKCYRHMLLGPLPHVLIALHECIQKLSQAKKDFTGRLLGAKHPDFDKENELITVFNKLRKVCIRIQKDVQPTSTFHHRGSCEELKQRVDEIKRTFEETLKELPTLSELKWDMEMGYKGIVQDFAPPTAKTPKRPSLNTDDLDIY